MMLDSFGRRVLERDDRGKSRAGVGQEEEIS